MTSQYLVPKSEEQNRADYGFARVRDLAFDAVQSLWRRRSAQGMMQTDIARALGHDPAWVNRNLRGPGNWTLRTLGELIEAMNGEIQITVYGMEDPVVPCPNYHAYAGYEVPLFYHHGTAQGLPPSTTAGTTAGTALTPMVHGLLNSSLSASTLTPNSVGPIMNTHLWAQSARRVGHD